ncbi:MAG: hypothetical protein CMI26_05135 [Opitutae bacterium]|nr:hypothetical protein [Opitutae bacterium]
MSKEETQENPTDSMIDEEVEETSINAKHRPIALGNLIGGYAFAVAFAVLVFLGMSDDGVEVAQNEDKETVNEGELAGAAEGAESEDSIISLVGGKSIAWPLGQEWTDPGWTASVDGEDMTAFVEELSFVDVNEPGQHKVIYSIKDTNSGQVLETKERFVTVNAGGFVRDNDVFVDRGNDVLINRDRDLVVDADRDNGLLFVDNDDRHLRLAGRDLGDGAVEGGVGGPDRTGFGGRGGRGGHGGDDDVDLGILDRRLGSDDDDLLVINDDDDLLVVREDDDLVRDRDNIGLDLGGNNDVDATRFELDENGRGDDDDLGDVGDFADDGRGEGKGDLPGIGEGSQVYAYNFPSQGVGAGIGNAGVGAAAGFAGIGAGIGQAVLDGKAVPALGGIGSYAPAAPAAPAGPDSDGDELSDAMESAFKTNPQSNDTDKDGVSDSDEIRGLSNPLMAGSKPGTPAPGGDADGDGVPASLEALYGLSPTNEDTDGDGFNDGEELAALTNPKDPASNPGESGGPALALAPGVAGGVGGLVNGAGAGVAAGLMPGQVKLPLGLGVGNPGVGVADGIGGVGGVGHDHNERHWENLPPDGNLFIMMYVDESGSIISTRKALMEMRDGMMKEALLPYYMNDESLYNRRVQVVGTKDIGTPGIADDGERSLEFFAAAAKKENVLALAFQDEGAPSYHLPTFNKNPEKHYLKDLGVLRNRLNGFGGVYRGVMFQVDRGKTFAKSFKEFVESAWQGENYLSGKGHNLKPYYWQENLHHIRNHDGVVFSDEYHLQSEGDPQYYLDAIFKAAKKVGLELGRYGGGLEDGKYVGNKDGGKIAAQVSTSTNSTCPMKPGRAVNPSITVVQNGKTIAFCCNGCKSKFVAKSRE